MRHAPLYAPYLMVPQFVLRSDKKDSSGRCPVGGTVTLSYYLETPTAVRLTVLDALGRNVLVAAAGGEQGAAAHSVAVEAGRLAPRVCLVWAVIGEGNGAAAGGRIE